MRGSKFIILAIAIIISLMGVLSIYSSTYQKEELWQGLYKRQILWVLIGLVIFFFISNINYLRFWDAAYILYVVSIFLLLLVFLLGIVRMGAQRWLKVVWLNFQPSEFAKLVMVLFFSRYFSKKRADEISLASARSGIFSGVALPFIFLLFPMGLIIEQPDLGTGIMLLGIFIVMLYGSGVRLKYILLFLSLLICLAPILWHFMHGYQKERLLVFLNPN
ncbi:MAG TPA: FtsW/RodA/SpoVE family cell cycle protein, partial [Candidatus Omnitrophota bacterium]|nr:FtsW/RodA/SpoVE family cell cycle protein [Candidatus Omnitrophota bacterium]